MTTKTPMELADEIERLHLQFEEAKKGSIEDRAVPTAKLQATLMVNRVEIIAALRQSARRESLLREAMSYLPHFTEFLKRIEQELGETS